MDTTGFRNGAVAFCVGGISGATATCVIQPIDSIKVQVQVLSEQAGKVKTEALSIMNIFYKIKREKGLSVLYRGLDSAILRQIFYASARIGAYESSLKYLEKNEGRRSTSSEKILLSIGSGAFGALIGTPFDVALIRRQASISTNINDYPNTLSAFRSIIVKEGFWSLWRGLNISMLRVASINMGQLAGKDIISDYFRRFQLSAMVHDNMTVLLASLLTAALSLPIDNLKVKLQKQDKSSTVYKGIVDCLLKSVQREGFLRLWVGLPIYIVRGTPHSYILLRTQQFLNEQVSQYSP